MSGLVSWVMLGDSPDLRELWACLLVGADALSQVAGRSNEMSVTTGASRLG